jgi:Na+/melibiose symporter-like transporter
MPSRSRFRASSLASLLAAASATAVLGTYIGDWIDVHESDPRALFFVVTMTVPIAAVVIAALIDGIGRPVLIMGGCVSFALIAIFEVIALRPTSSIGAWLTVSAGLALVGSVAVTIERSMPLSRSLRGLGIGFALGVSYVALAGLLETRSAPG